MSEISPVGPGTAGIISLSPASVALAHRASLNGHAHGINGVDQPAGSQPPSLSRQPDRVELSDRALSLGLEGAAEIRQDRVASARQLIERGEYPNDQQIEVAIERMMTKLRD